MSKRQQKKVKFKIPLWWRIKAACGVWWVIVRTGEYNEPQEDKTDINCANIEKLRAELIILKKSLVPLKELKRLIKQGTNGSIKKAIEESQQADNLLKPSEVDALLRYPKGRTLRLVEKGLIRYVKMPNLEIRIREFNIKQILSLNSKKTPK